MQIKVQLVLTLTSAFEMTKIICIIRQIAKQVFGTEYEGKLNTNFPAIAGDVVIFAGKHVRSNVVRQYGMRGRKSSLKYCNTTSYVHVHACCSIFHVDNILQTQNFMESYQNYLKESQRLV